MSLNYFYRRELGKLKAAAAVKANAEKLKAHELNKPAQKIVLPRSLFKGL